MYTVAILLQYLGIIAAIVGFFIVFPKRMSKRKQLLILILMSVLINEMGYLFELQAKTMEAAIVSIKFAYVGKLFAELAILVFVLDYTNVWFPMWMKALLGAAHTYVIGLIWNCENNKLYYSRIEFTQEGLYPHVVLGHGIVYNIFTGFTFAYMAIIMIVCMVRFVQAKSRAQRVRMLCLSTPPITFVIGLLLFQSGVTQGYDTTAISYLICACVFVFAIMKYDLVEESEIVKEMMLDEFSEAVIVFDNEGKAFYANKQFQSLYPTYLENSNLHEKIGGYGQKKEIIQFQDKFYRVIAKDIIQEGISRGVMYVFRNVTEECKRMELMDHYNRDLQNDVEEKTKSIVELQNQLVLGMADMVEGRDANTGGHIKRSSHVVKILIDKIREDEELKLDDLFCDSVVKAAPMHDLGKIAVDDAILRKPGKFTEEEFEQMKQHAGRGAEIVGGILENIEDRYFAKIAENVAHYHHERVDGTGYPDQLVGDEIPFEARIMAVADVYDALVSKRCYKDSMPFDKAFDLIMQGMGNQFDKRLEPYFYACREELEAYYAQTIAE